MVSTVPTVFHVTHVKSGSQWVYNILEGCAPGRIVKPRVKVAQFYEDAILPGMIYPTVYVSQPRFEATLRPQNHPSADHQIDSPAYKNWRNFVELQLPIKVFFVMRDLRDTLVSLYFSLKVSHAIISDNVAEGIENSMKWILRMVSYTFVMKQMEKPCISFLIYSLHGCLFVIVGGHCSFVMRI